MSDWDTRTTHEAAEGPQWVSAAEAADAAGVTPGTVRYWARAGLIVSEVVPGPAGERTLVRLDEVLRHARQASPASSSAYRGPSPAGDPGEVVTDLPARTSELAPILKSIPEIMAQLTAATDRAARAETKVEFLSAQLQDMRRRLAEAEGGPRSSPEPTLPEAWEAPAQPPETPAADPRATGWPAPAAGDAPGIVDWGAATSDAPAEPPPAAREEPEPPGDVIDWGARGPATDPETEEVTPARGEPDRLTLGQLWAPPSRDEAPAPPEPPAPAGGDGVDWHPPASSRDGREEEAQPGSPKPANATVPDEDFYGPRLRRRWFRRRR